MFFRIVLLKDTPTAFMLEWSNWVIIMDNGTIKTEYLLSNNIKDEFIEKVSDLDVATDGIMFDNFNNLFLGGLEDNSINVYTYNNELMKLIKDKRIKWADSFARDSSGNMYFTTSQLHLPPNEKGKYSIYKINMK